MELGDNSVTIRIVVQCAESDRLQLERDLNREMKLIFDKHDISIPFPQVVINQPTVFKKATAVREAQRRPVQRRSRRPPPGSWATTRTTRRGSARVGEGDDGPEHRASGRRRLCVDECNVFVNLA